MGVRMAADDVTGGSQRSDVRGLQEGSLADPGGHDEEMRAPSPLLELLGAIQSARTAVIESDQHMPAMVQASEVDVRDQFRRHGPLGNGVEVTGKGRPFIGVRQSAGALESRGLGIVGDLVIHQPGDLRGRVGSHVWW